MIPRREFVTGLGGLALSAGAPRLVRSETDGIFRAGMVLSPGPEGRCDDARVGGPVVRWDASQQQWRMWYYCRSSRFPGDMAPEFGSGSIATAESTDGFRWQRVDGPLAEGAVFTPSENPGAFDTGHVATGDVVRDGDGWLMAYFAGNSEVPQGAKPMHTGKGYLLRIGVARSDDGMRWRRLPGPETGGAVIDVPAGDVYAAFPGVYRDGDRYLLYYTTVDKQARYWRQRIAVSSDGDSWASLGDMKWLDEPELFEGGGTITRDVMRNPFAEDPPWLMVYTAKDGRSESGARRSIGVAVSEDAITWRRLFRQPVFWVGREGAWDHGGVAVPRLVVTDEDVRLYYYGWSDQTYAGPAQRGIGCAVASLDEPWRFRRYPAASG